MNNKVLGISYTVWSLIGLVVFNALTTIAPFLQGNIALVANLALVILTGVMHSQHVQSASVSGSTD